MDAKPKEFEIGIGIWCGLIYAISGGLGLAAVRRPSKCL
jgi:hypothetical protein